MAGNVLANPLVWHADRTDDALCITILTWLPWLPDEPVASVIVMLADHGMVWQLLPLLRASQAWARSRHAVEWQCQSDTRKDIGPLMKRLGATAIQERPRYVVELKE